METHPALRNKSGEELDRKIKDSPSYWFSVLQTAVELNDYQLAAEAQRELERLDVEVKFGRARGKESTRAR